MKNYKQYSPRASMAVMGKIERKMELWNPIEELVHIAQKKSGYAPVEKLKDAWINILCGGHGIVEINTRVRPDPGLQRAFGRSGCGEQSTISRALNACTSDTVEQLRQAQQEIFRRYSRCMGHDYGHHYLVLDVDMTGLLAGRQGEGVTKGFFSGKVNGRGRQVGRVLAWNYNEVVVDQLYPGIVQLERSLQELVERAEQTLGSSAEQRQHILVRVDGGGGRDEDVNWLLQRGYLILLKVKNWQRSRKLLERVSQWYPDPRHPQRQMGWVDPAFAYACPTRQIGVREQREGTDCYECVLVTNAPAEVWGLPASPAADDQQLLSAILHTYDLRSGGVETANRNSKSGLGLKHRNKRSFAAQAILVLLAQLAYNFLSWVQVRLAQHQSQFQSFGWLRITRDLFHIPGLLFLAPDGTILAIRLSRDHPFARSFCLACRPLIEPDHLSLYLRKI